MKRFFSFLAVALLAFGVYDYSLSAEATAQELTDSELNSYYAALKKQVDKQNQVVQGMMQSLEERKTIFSQAQRAQMEQAIIMLDVKKTLYSNFVGTETIKKSPAVRDMLLKVLSQNVITESDLASLQALVTQEKLRLKKQ